MEEREALLRGVLANQPAEMAERPAAARDTPGRDLTAAELLLKNLLVFGPTALIVAATIYLIL